MPKEQKKIRADGGASGDLISASDNEADWFTEKLVADQIIGATDEYGDLQFLIKWKDVQKADLVPSKLANEKIPQVFFEFLN